MTRLSGFVRNGERWIGRSVADGVVPILPIDDFYADVPAGLRRASEVDGAILRNTVPTAAVPLSAKILCAAMNYPRFILDPDDPPADRPSEPELFGRWTTSLASDGDEVPMPAGEQRLDWEGELAVVLGARCGLGTTAMEAEGSVLGFSAFNDLTARDHLGRFFTVGKNAGGSGPLGPHLVSADEVPDRYDLRIVTYVNGEVMQDGSTADMFFRIGEIVAHATKCMTLEPGDVIATGTPPGVGAYREPPIFLSPGDVVSVEISSVGSITNRIVAGSCS